MANEKMSPKKPLKGEDMAQLIAQSKTISDALRANLNFPATEQAATLAQMSEQIKETIEAIDAAKITPPKLIDFPALPASPRFYGGDEPIGTSSPGGPAPITSASDLGNLVRQAREDKMLSQQNFADLAGVGRRFVSELENGKSTLEFEKVLKVAHAAGITFLAKQR